MSELNPHNTDAILGGQNPSPTTAVVLGGIAGVQQRLASESIVAKLQALKDVNQYGTSGIDLALQALSDPAEEVKRLARKLLRNQTGEEGRSALLSREALHYFSTLADWQWEFYNPEIGIVDPENNAYVIRMTNAGSWINRKSYDLSQFETLLKDPRIGELQALIFQIDFNYYDDSHTFGIALEAIIDAKDLFPNLQGLFVGDSTGDHPVEYRRSKLHVFDIRPFLESFPELEILQVYGRFDDEYTLECAGFKHEKLKTLIIETAHLSGENLSQIGGIHLPNLEYFEIWLGKWGSSASYVISALESILSGYGSPKLKYLGLCSDENTNSIISEVLKTPIISQLAVLDFKMGTMTAKGVEYLLQSSDLNNLKYLNVFGNDLPENAVIALAQLTCQVNADNLPIENDNEDEEYYSGESRRWALHE
jgi:hypothetical protein